MKTFVFTLLLLLSLFGFKLYAEHSVLIDGQELEQAVRYISFDGDTAILHLTDGGTINTNCLLLKIEFSPASGLTSPQQIPVLLARNPVSNQLKLENLKTGGNLVIYDTEGRTLKKLSIGSSSLLIDISDFPAGVYMLKTEKSLIRFIKQ